MIILDRSSKFNQFSLGYTVAGVKTDKLACFTGLRTASRKAHIFTFGKLEKVGESC